jgi:hypothetical protein
MTDDRQSEELMSSSNSAASGRVHELYWLAIIGADPGPLAPAEAALFTRLREAFAATPGTDLWPVDDG